MFSDSNATGPSRRASSTHNVEVPLHALVIDDQILITQLVADVLRSEGWDVTETTSAEQAFALLDKHDWALVVCDVQLGGVDGFSVLRRFKEELPATRVVLMTGYGTAAGALNATSFGAYDYLLKPLKIDQLELLSRSLQDQLRNRSTRRVTTTQGATAADVGLLGRSGPFIEVMKQVGRVANTSLSVLLTGESGTGKEVVAAALHRRSTRSDKPFIAVNCGAISADLIESELFGHVKGAFTGAERDRVGLWEEADRGTVFLDEITETTLAFQVKLLRALQEGEFRRVGSNQMQRVDVRVIAASNRNVEEEVKAGRFREDLYYRLNAVSIALPPLRQRKEDILLLARSFADRVYSIRPAVKFSPDVLELLEQYPWPGNIRELENAIVRAAAICDGTIRRKDLPERVQRYQATESPQATETTEVENWLTLAETESRYVSKVLTHTENNKQAAARILGIDRKTLDRMIKRHNILIEQIARASPHGPGLPNTR